MVYYYLSKGDVDELVRLIRGTRWDDEDEVFDCAVELGRVSVFLRSGIIAEDDFDEGGGG